MQRPQFTLLLALAFTAEASATVINVPADYPTIKAAINAAVDGDTVLVAPGTYVEIIDFLGKAITVKSSAGAGVTIIDGNQLGSVVSLKSGEGPLSLLEGFTLTNGLGTDIGTWRAGGAVYCDGTSPTIRNNVMTQNNYPGNGELKFGGGVYAAHGAAPLIIGNIITDNEVPAGAGIYCDSSSPIIQANHITFNYAYDSGGGIACWSCPAAVISGNTITDNVGEDGGGLICVGDTATIAGNFIARNSDYDQGGGGLHLVSWSGTVTGNTLESNQGSPGSGLLIESCNPLIEANVFRANVATGVSGEAIWCDDVSSPTIANNTFVDNVTSAAVSLAKGTVQNNEMSANGGGVVCRGAVVVRGNHITGGSGPGVIAYGGVQGSAVIDSNVIAFNLDSGIQCSNDTIVNNTITGNTAFDFGGGIRVGAFTTPVIRNNIVWDNSAPMAGAEIYVESGGAATVTYCDVKGGWPGTGNIDQDPQFTAPGAGDFSLQPSSPCIEAGDPADKPTGRDAASQPRRLDGDLDRMLIVDIGAIEFDHVHLAVGGSATPGGTLTVDTTGTAGLSVILFIALAAGELPVPPFGALFIDFSRPWFLLPWGTIPSSVQGTIPPGVPTPLPILLQELARDVGLGAGNTSNAVELVIE